MLNSCSGKLLGVIGVKTDGKLHFRCAETQQCREGGWKADLGDDLYIEYDGECLLLSNQGNTSARIKVPESDEPIWLKGRTTRPILLGEIILL